MVTQPLRTAPVKTCRTGISEELVWSLSILACMPFLSHLDHSGIISPDIFVCTCPMRSFQTFEPFNSLLLAMPESSTFDKMLLCPDNSETSTLRDNAGRRERQELRDYNSSSFTDIAMPVCVGKSRW